MKKIIAFIISFNCYHLFAQKQDADILCNDIIAQNIENTNLYSNEEEEEEQALTEYSTLASFVYNQGHVKTLDSIKLALTSSLPSHQKSTLHKLELGYYHLYNSPRNGRTYQYLFEAYTASTEINNECYSKLALLGLLDFYARENTLNEESFLEYLEIYSDLAISKNEIAWKYFYQNLFDGRTINYTQEKFRNSGLKNIDFFHKNKSDLSQVLKANLIENIGVHYRINNQIDSSKFYFNQLLRLPEKPVFIKNKFIANLDLGELAAREQNFVQAQTYFNSAQDYLSKADTLRSQISLYRFKAHYYYYPKKEFDSAYIYLNDSFNLNRLVSYEENSSKISELNVNLQTAEKEKELLEIKVDRESERAQKERLRNISYGLVGFLILGTIIALLLHRNTKRKQRIAEQEKELEIQKTEKVLKEKEIETINAMVSGQEKERQRLAGELHDNLGSTLATVRMQVENLERNLEKVDDPKALLSKTNVLINEAYEKVRTISHERNAGVLAKDGLLPALHKLSRSVSNNNLSVQIQDFGLENRLSNESEITIFRIIQELVTNALKHANASEISIALTQHESELNIMVEDDGIGFKVGKFKSNEGMGLGSIERRVEHLEGTMEVDSSPGNGTNVIIDIPL